MDCLKTNDFMSAHIFLDMVHHNPGELRFHARFTDPNELATLGYNGQALKHLNACAPLGFSKILESPQTHASRYE